MAGSIEILRAQIETLGDYVSRETLSSSQIVKGLPRGAITQISGPGKTEFAVLFLKDHPEFNAAWIESIASIYPCGILQRKVSLNRILFIEAGNEVPWVVGQVLKSGLFEVIILSSLVTDLKLLRRFQLATEKAHAALILISEIRSAAWPIALQLESSRNQKGQLKIEVIRER